MPCADRGSDLDSQLSRQPLITFEPRFVFPDRLDARKRLQRSNTFRAESAARIRGGDFQEIENQGRYRGRHMA